MIRSMNALLFVFLIGLFIAAPSMANAEEGWRGEGKITELFNNYHNTGVSVKLSNSVPLNGCAIADEVIVNRSIDGYSDIYAALLSSLVTGKKVDIYVNGKCQNQRNIGVAFSFKIPSNRQSGNQSLHRQR